VTVTHWLVLPLVLHVLLTFAVGALNLRSRIAAVRRGRARIADVTLDNAKWPNATRKLGNNFDNQFQVPLLAYGAVALIVALGLADVVGAGLMWAFLAARILHTVEHTGPNRIVRRMVFFVASFAAVLALWLWFALRFFVTG
jgi:hypothetical protein